MPAGGAAPAAEAAPAEGVTYRVFRQSIALLVEGNFNILPFFAHDDECSESRKNGVRR